MFLTDVALGISMNIELAKNKSRLLASAFVGTSVEYSVAVSKK
uniref:Uncharacterized protein n=1 Tax=Arundo donax TaxID=35708 RepID=A0A0A9B7X5_ARUDO